MMATARRESLLALRGGSSPYIDSYLPAPIRLRFPWRVVEVPVRSASEIATSTR